MAQTVEPGWVLGIWDGHDAGAALLQGDAIVSAVNEERLSRRKLDVGFPVHSIRACLDSAGLSPDQVTEVGFCTSDPAKTLTRYFPQLKEAYYRLRRREIGAVPLHSLKRAVKYRLTEFGPNRLSTRLSSGYFRRELRRHGFANFRLSVIDHHHAHAQTAARCCGFKPGLVATLDGVGDGCCGSLWIYKNDRLQLLRRLSARLSLGVFFEHVTRLMNMRELEDEGKVMALANYANPVADELNPLMGLIRTGDLRFAGAHRHGALYKDMKKIFWHYPPEQFAYMAQRVVETRSLTLLRTAVERTGIRDLAVAGGLFANIIVNMKAEALEEVDNLYVFPHMGDGGLALGSAMAVNFQRHGIARYYLPNLHLGPKYAPDAILRSFQNKPLKFHRLADRARTAAELILQGEIILWFQGRMEYGPRALGNRSILGRADSVAIRDRLNLALKKRVWYQPFCPSLLIEDAHALLHTEDRVIENNRFMTTAFRVRTPHLCKLAGVMNVDRTCRPQFVAGENPLFQSLLRHVKAALGYGVLLNTSFNIHGEPLVCSPEDAVETLQKSGVRHLVIEDYLVENIG
jgi:carbamoyltransferase